MNVAMPQPDGGTGTTPLVEVKNLKKHFPIRKGIFSRVSGHVYAVDGVSFHIAPGETLGLVGESGSGKTTVGRCLLRLIEPTAGEIRYQADSIGHLSQRAFRSYRPKMQAVFQDPYDSLDPRITVGDTILESIALWDRAGNRRQRQEKLLRLAELVRLRPDQLNLYPRELSGVFAREFDAARTTVASGLAVEIEPAPGVRVVDAAGYPLESVGSRVILRPGSLFAGQERRLWLTLAVPQHSVGEYPLGRFSVAYGAAGDRKVLTFSDVPQIACVAGEDEFYSSVDVSAWTRSVVVDSYNAMQKDVAQAVKEGRRDDALKRVQQFKDEAGALNARLNSAPVADKIGSLGELETLVSGAFEGPEQAQRQNALSKAKSAEAMDSRRAGSKK